LLAWNDEREVWDEAQTLTSEKYGFKESNGEMYTDLLLPFDSLSMSSPATTMLKMVAIASNENGLRPWSTMPQINQVSDFRLLRTGAYAGDGQFFALTHYYEWASLGQGVCPNGKLGPPSANDYFDTDLQMGVTTNPEGTIASYFGDNLFWLWVLMLGGGPDKAPPGINEDGSPPEGAHGRPPAGRDNQIANLGDLRANFRDTEHAPVYDGQVIHYTLTYQNQGTETATGVKANISSFFALRLPAGTHLEEEKRDRLVLDLSDLLPGQTSTIVFTGTVDVATSRNEYHPFHHRPCPEW
jgi:hypothetical protein